MAYESTLGVPFLTGIIVIVSLFLVLYRSGDPLLDAIPTIGWSDPILSYISALRYNFFDGRFMIEEGYKKSKPGLFKIPGFRRWVVLAAGAELIEDVKRAPDHILSTGEAVREFLEMDYTLPMLHHDDTYQIGVIRSKLTRNFAATFDQVQDELVQALTEFIPLDSGEWVKISILPTIQQVICRTSGRMLVGAPLCRNRDYQKLATNFAINVFKIAYVVSMFPKPLKPIVARFISSIPSQVRRTMELIEPMVKERFAKIDEFGGETWEDAPDDMLMWLMSEAKGVERSLEGLARRLLLVNLAAIQSTSLTFIQILYRLLATPEYVESLRQEIGAAVAEEGWTKAGMDKLHRLDSFVRESQRMDILSPMGVARIAIRPFTFSNGITIPAGTIVAAPTSAIHVDEELYSNPHKFDGFRFFGLHDSDGKVTRTGNSAVSTSPNHLAFGLGRHACHGRFFAVSQMKVLLARIIMTYDVKLEEGKGVPREHRMGALRFPRDTVVLFRKRPM